MEQRETNEKTTRHSKYNLNYHFVWIPKYRRPVFRSEEKRELLREIFREIAEDKGIEIFEIEIMSDHVHMFCSVPPRIQPSKIANWFKGISSRKYNARYDDKIKWTRSYYVGSAGDVSAETIQRYIAEQEE